MSGQGIRARRVAESIRAHLAEALSREIGDPRLAGVVVTSVGLPDDLSVAWITVRKLQTENSPRAQKGVVTALEGASGRLRRGLGPAIRLKRVPELRFAYDTGQEAAHRVETILKEIEQDKKTREPEPDGD